MQNKFFLFPGEKGVPLRMANIDFYFRNAISFISLMPVSVRAELWVKENLNLESWQDKNEISLEPRMFEGIYEGLINLGMVVKPSS
jgi:hypothetical protein